MEERARTARLAAALERVPTDGADDRRLRADALAVVRRFVPFDAYAFLLTDPETGVGCSPVADVPDLARLPDLIRLKYLTPVNRWTRLPTSGAAGLQQVTGGRPERSLLWREHLAGLGVRDVASIVFADRFGCWGFLDLWRHDGVFTDGEVAALAAGRAGLTRRLRAVQAAGCRAAPGPQRHRGPGALVLSPSLEIRAQTAQTERWFEVLVPPGPGAAAVPASAYNVAAQLLALRGGVDDRPAQARVHLGGGSWLTLRADDLGGARSRGDIVVTMEVTSPAERRDVLARSHGLTPRETELLRHLCDGHDTRALARLMSISQLTVQDHLKSVFGKTCTASRRELLAVCLGS